MRHRFFSFSRFFKQPSELQNDHWDSFIWLCIVPVCGNHFCLKIILCERASEWERVWENKKIRCYSSLLFLSIELRAVICMRPRGHHIRKVVQTTERKRKKRERNSSIDEMDGRHENERTSLSIYNNTTSNQLASNSSVGLSAHNPIELICSITFAGWCFFFIAPRLSGCQFFLLLAPLTQ